MEMFNITRRITIDAAHRVPEHGSKCRRLHGHTYHIEATCQGELASEGEEVGMVVDFSFLKEGMMKTIHDYCDHATILKMDDNLVTTLAGSAPATVLRHECNRNEYGYAYLQDEYNKLYVIDRTPTAENLAQHWYKKLERVIAIRTNKRVKLSKLRVAETPNCYAEYPG